MNATIEVNGKSERLAADALSDLLRAHGIEPVARGFAVAVNGALVPRTRWAATKLRAGDKVDIVRAFAGG
jgi:sulfur carrier protein